ncbi:MAG: flagellar brake protein [Planctomycetota bacterium]|jgi:c-di-GMP-binding flagellar brake protein YcgR
MNEPQLLTIEEVKDALSRAVQDKITGVLSHFTGGIWHRTKIAICTVSNHTLHVEPLAEENNKKPADIQINQPVGISIQRDFDKYIFETVVAGIETSVNQSKGGKIVLELPDKVERMQRRAYTRMPVPKSMNVQVLFWHRGYSDDSKRVPLENYWQGRLLNISAGGVQIAVDRDQEPNFRVSQLVGLQFTPMSYEKPIHVEGQVRHIAQTSNGEKLEVGVEFIGLEASGQGRQKLHRIVNAVNEYERRNRLNGNDPAIALGETTTEAETITPFSNSGVE